MARALMALGSNLGDRPTLLRSALLALDRAPRSRLLKRSRSYATQPVGGPAGQDGFLNAAALIETQLPPQRLLDELHAIEHSLGRASAERWTARTIDLDLLLYDGPRGRDSFATGESLSLAASPVAKESRPPTPPVANESRPHERLSLELPHPRMAYRRFVLQPAAEIAGSMLHPESGWTVAELLAQLNRGADVVALAAASPVETSTLVSAIAARLDLPLQLLSPTGRPGIIPWQARSLGTTMPGEPRPKLLLARRSSAGDDLRQLRTILHLPPRGPVAWIGGDPALTPLDEACAAIESVWPNLASGTI